MNIPWRKNRYLFFLETGFLILILVFSWVNQSRAEGANIDARTLVSRMAIYPLPRNGAFLKNSTFEVPIIIDTKGYSVNTIELHIEFDPAKLMIIKPSGDKSIIGVWLEPPSYSNSNGTAKFVGVIPNGITTDSGLITTISFKAIAIGQAAVSITESTRVLLNDGAGTEAGISLGRGVYDIMPLPPEGIKIFSETHPDQDKWYNNPNPVLDWEKGPGVTTFSYILDNMPFTFPDNAVSATSTMKAYQNLNDGLWYFHIKAQKQGVWGAATHFLVRIGPFSQSKTGFGLLYHLSWSGCVSEKIFMPSGGRGIIS